MIEVQRITKRYGATTAVDDLSFQVKPGTVTGFLGPNGSGKSTTMRLIMGLDYPDSGVSLINGRRYQELPNPLSVVGALLEARAIHPGRTAYSHLLALAYANKFSSSRVREVLDIVGLGDVANKRVGKFSLGMSQRLGIAAALLGDPEILLLDEPVNGLDPEGILWVRNLLKGLAGEGRTIFVSSHLMSEMALTADHVIVIGKGHLIADAPMAQFIADNSSKRVVVRTPRTDQLAQSLEEAGAEIYDISDRKMVVGGISIEEVGEMAYSIGIPLHELSQVTDSLEKAFMDLTSESVAYSGKLINSQSNDGLSTSDMGSIDGLPAVGRAANQVGTMQGDGIQTATQEGSIPGGAIEGGSVKAGNQ